MISPAAIPSASLLAAALAITFAAVLTAAPAAGAQALPLPPAPPAPATHPPTLAEALAALRGRPKVDLTHPFDAATPMPPGFTQPRVTPAVDPRTLEPFTLRRDGFRATYYALPGPAGTHVVAPAAVAADGRTLDRIPPDEMILPMVVLDDTPYLAADPAHGFSTADLAAHEKAHGRVPAGSFVALRTGLGRSWGTPAFERRPFPAWTLAVLKVLLEERGVVAVGQESLEATAGGEGSAYLLGRGRWMLGGLANLDALPPTGAALLAFWPRAAEGFSFPARAVAVLP